jgi:ribosomal protein S18 acetylase RimI-like enzyme
VDQRYKGQGLGRLLLFDALYRIVQAGQHISTRAVIVDAVDDAAVAFYEHHNFVRFADDSRRLYRTMDTIRAIFAQATAPPTSPS